MDIFLVNLDNFVLNNLILDNYFSLNILVGRVRNLLDLLDINWYFDDLFNRNFNDFLDRDLL